MSQCNSNFSGADAYLLASLSVDLRDDEIETRL
jgi:hypothetical protein